MTATDDMIETALSMWYASTAHPDAWEMFQKKYPDSAKAARQRFKEIFDRVLHDLHPDPG